MVVSVRNGVFALALFSTAACSDPGYYSSPAFFANTTRAPVNVRLSRLDASVACNDVARRSGGVFSRSAFVPEATYRVEAGQALPLGPIAEDGAAYDTPSCGAVMLQILGQEDLAAFWLGARVQSEKRANLDDQNFRDHAVRLEGTTGLQRLAVGAQLEGSEPARIESGGAAPPRLFGWSGRTFGLTTQLARRDVLPDGCLAIGDMSGTVTLYLCVPDWAFPFQIGDSLFATQMLVGANTVDAGPPPSARKLVVQDSTTNPTKVLEIWLDAFGG
ncbi:MAG TPA: hypothetical protein VMS65_02110, partial [Polyangiaceae bacterium]|nr:hypothetical protein [Polyangiaceae bacterium]